MTRGFETRGLSTAALVLLAHACSTIESPTSPDAPAGEDAPEIDSGQGVFTLAGHAERGDVDGDRLAARFANPVSVAYGPDGLVYVADFDNGKIRVIDPEDGATHTLVAQPGFSRPFAIAFAPDGTLYVTTDRSPNATTQTPMSGTIWRVDEGVATPIAIGVGRPRGIVALADGRLAISDYQHHVVQLVDPVTGTIAPLAGGWDGAGFADGAGPSARFANPYGMALFDGKLAVADKSNHRIRLVALDGTVTTLAGTGVAGFADGASAMLHEPQALAVANGELFVTDLANFRVRRVRDGAVDTLAGSGTGGHLDSSDFASAQLFGLEGIAVTPDGSKLFVADGSRGEDAPYHRVRTINRQGGS